MSDLVAHLRDILEKHRNDPDRDQLTGVQPDKAFDYGYWAAVDDVETFLASQEN